MVIFPSDAWEETPVAILAACEDLMKWLNNGGDIMFYTHPSYDWREKSLLTALLEINVTQLGVNNCEDSAGRKVGIAIDSAAWDWAEQNENIGFSGSMKKGEGTIHLTAMAE